LTDAESATTIASAINNDGGDGSSGYASTYVVASASAAVVTLTAKISSVLGDGITLSATTDTGTAVASGATLTGGSSDSYNL